MTEEGLVGAWSASSGVQARRDHCSLIMLLGPSPGASQPVLGPELVLGRDEALPARIEDRGISKRHARVFRVMDHFYLEDLGSTNGTLVNGARIGTRHRLQDGDRIQLGEGTLLRVCLQEAAEARDANRRYFDAVLDPLTRLYNRPYFEDRLRSEHAFTLRHEVPLTIVFIDIDHFSRVNEAHGRAGGDAVLASLGATLGGLVRSEDLLARYGGEEMVLSSRLPPKDALALAERMRRTIEAHRTPFPGGVIAVTASVGVATVTPERSFPTPDSLLAAADEAAYRAKCAGRNRVCSTGLDAPGATD